MANFQVRNSQTLKKFLNNQPAHARQAILEWQEFAHDNHDVAVFTTSEEWFSYVATHPGTDKYLWVGKELEVVSSDPGFVESPEEKESTEEHPELPGGASFGHAVGGFANALSKADILEHDWDYVKVEYEMQQKWLKDNGKKDFYSSDGADFLFGSLTDPTKPSLASQTEQELLELSKTKPKLAKKLEEFREKKKKTNSDLRYDPYVAMTQTKISRELEYRFYVYKQENSKATEKEKEDTYKQLSETILKNSWERFVISHPEKVQEYTKNAYSKHNAAITEAVKRLEIQEAQKKSDNVDRKFQEQKSQQQLIRQRKEGAHLIEDLMGVYNERYPQKGLADIQEDDEEDRPSQNVNRRDIERAMRQAEPGPNPPQPPKTPRISTQRSSPALPRAPRIPVNPGQLATLGRAAGAIGIVGNPLFWIGLLALIFIVVVVILFADSGEGTQAFPNPPTPGNPLQIGKGVSKTEITINDTIQYSLKVSAHSLAGDKISVTEKIPLGTAFVSADSDAIVSGDTITWNLDTSRTVRADRPIPEPQQPPPQELIRSVQRVSITEDQIRQELIGLDSPYAEYANTVFSVGQKHNVDPALIMAIWRMENAYGLVGGYHNNPGSIVYVKDGYLGGQKRGRFNHGRYWGTWDTFEQGLEAIALLIKNEYYPRGQTDTWSIHSGLGPNGSFAYHGRGDIGIGDIQTWADYVRFYYNWITVMDRIGGGSYSIDKTLTFSVRPAADNIWVTNRSTGFAPGNGEASSNEVVVKVGNPPEENRPGTPTVVPPAPTRPQDLQRALDENFSIQVTPSPLLTQTHMTWMWEALWRAKQKAPNFFPLLKSRFTAVRIVPINGMSETDNSSGAIKLGPNTLATNKELFQQIFVHELGHIIHGFAGSATGQPYDQAIRSAWQQEGQLTRYSRENEDEAFAELVSYYILDDIVEQPTRYRDLKWPGSNPLKTNAFPRHLAFIESVLGK